MTPEEVPDELLDMAHKALRFSDESDTESALADALAAVLPAHREYIAKEIEAHGATLMAQAVEQVKDGKPEGFTATFRAAAVTSAAKVVRGTS